MSENTSAISSPGVAVAAVPYLLTFTPQNSLVMLWLKADGSLLVTQRIDLPDNLQPDTVASWHTNAFSHQARDMAAAMIAIFVPPPRTSLAGVMEACLAPIDENFIRSTLVTDFTTWSFAGESASHAVTADDVTRAAALLGTSAATRPAPNREAVVDGFTVGEKVSADILAAAKKRASQATTPQQVVDHHAAVLADAGDALRRGKPLTDTQVADLLIAWDTEGARDAFIALLTENDTHARVEDFAAVVRRAPRQHTAPAATIAAIYAWMRGDGLRANVALDVALEATPDYVLAEMIAAAVAAGIPPQAAIDTINELRNL